jgi:ElaB/YqjD/DUF883 family membrane-anchored ribosome-binding protein
MANNSVTIERVKEGVDGMVEKTRDIVNDRLDAARAKFDHAADRLDRRYRKAIARARGNAERASKVVHARLAEARTTVAKTYTQASKKVARVDRDARRYVADNPRKAVLLAAGVGILAGLVLSRARRGHAAG